MGRRASPVDPFLDVVARWLARNWDDAKVSEPALVERIFAMMASICCRLLPTARMIPPSRGIFLPTQECAGPRSTFFRNMTWAVIFAVDFREIAV